MDYLPWKQKVGVDHSWRRRHGMWSPFFCWVVFEERRFDNIYNSATFKCYVRNFLSVLWSCIECAHVRIFFYFFIAGRLVLPTSSRTGSTLGIYWQGCGTDSHALAWEKVEREGSSCCNGAHTLWRWEYPIYMHRACKQGIYFISLVIFYLFWNVWCLVECQKPKALW